MGFRDVGVRQFGVGIAFAKRFVNTVRHTKTCFSEHETNTFPITYLIMFTFTDGTYFGLYRGFGGERVEVRLGFWAALGNFGI